MDRRTAGCLVMLPFFLFFAAVSGLCAQDARDELARRIQQRCQEMAALRDALAVQLEGRLKADKAAGETQDFLLRLDEGTDQEEMQVFLHQRGGKWLSGYAVVPAWRQETYGERRGFYIENKVRYVFRDKFRYPVNVVGPSMTATGLTGSMEAFLRLNQLREERLPPGTPRVFHTGEVFSWLDRIGYLAHERLRKQRYGLETWLHKDTQEFNLVMEGGLSSTQRIHLTFRVPESPLFRALAWTPTFNQGFHVCDASGLTFRDGRLQGTLRITINPDLYHPKKPIVLTSKVDGAAAFGWFRGTHRTTSESGQTEGALRGRAGTAFSGHYRSSGDMGHYYGCLVQGLVSPARDRIVSFFQEQQAAEGEGIPAGLAQLHRVYRQARAAHLALRQYPLPVEEAWDQCGIPTPRWGGGDDATLAKEDLDDIGAYVDGLLAAAKTAATGKDRPFLRGVQAPPDPTFGPFGRSTPLPADGKAFALSANINSAGPQKWAHIPEWQVAGPFPQTDDLDHNFAEVPDVVPSSRSQYALHPACFPKDQQPKPGENILAGWRPVKAAGGMLEPPWSHEAGRGAFRGSVFFALAEVISDADREVWISAAALDHAKLWVNGRLAWVGNESPWCYRREQESIFKIALGKGLNRLLFRCREDRSLTWLRVHICVGGEPKTGADAAAAPNPQAWDAAGDGAGRFPDADPPLAWDLDKGINVLWKVSLPAAMTSRPVAAGGKLYVTTAPATLLCLNQEDGKVLWSSVGQAPAAGPQGEDCVLSDGQNAWVYHRGGLAAACDAQGQRKWTAHTGMDQATLKMAAGRLLVQGARAGQKDAHSLAALDASSGKELWKKELAEPYRPGFVLRLARGDKTFTGFLTQSLQLLDASTGEVVLPAADLDRSAECAVYLADDMVFFTQLYRKYAGGFFLDADGQVGCRFAWNNYYAYKYDGPVVGIALGKWFFTSSAVQEDRPGHSPVSLRELNIFDRNTGDPVGRIKPLIRRNARAWLPPAAAGEYLFVRDVGGDNKTDPGQVAVVHAAQWPTVVCRNQIDLDMTAAPVFDGNRMFWRKGAQGLICVSVTTPEGRRYQEEKTAATLAEYLGNIPQGERLPGPNFLRRVPAGPGVALANPADGRTPCYWLAAGPFPGALSAAEIEKLAGLREEAGGSLTLGGVSRQLAPLPQRWINVSISKYNYHLFEGLGMGLMADTREIDLVGFLEGKKDQSVVLHTTLVNSRPRLVTLQAPSAGVAVWITGSKVKPMSPLQLHSPAYVVTVLAGPEFLAGGKPLGLAFIESEDPGAVREAWLKKVSSVEDVLKRLARPGAPAAEQAQAYLRELADYRVREDLLPSRRTWRNDGSGCFPKSRPPVPMEPTTNILWKASLPALEGGPPVAQAACVYLGVPPASLLCLSWSNGGEVWRADIGGGAAGQLSAPAVDGDSVFAAASSGALACFGPDGKPRWQAKTAADAAGRRPSLLLADQVLIAQTANLAGFEASSGKLLWTVDLPKDAAGAPVLAAVGSEQVVFTSAGWAVRPSDGAVLSKALPPSGDLSPHVGGGIVYVASQGQVSAFALPSSAVPGMSLRALWENKSGMRPAAAPLAHEGRLYILCDKGLRVLNAASGVELRAEALSPNRQVPSELLLAGEHLFVTNIGTECRTLVYRPGEKLEKVWEFAVPGGCQTPYFIWRNMYVRAGGTLFCLSGEAPRAPEAFTAPPVAKAAEGYTPPEGVPVVAFESNQMPRSWLIGGPFKPRTLDEDFLKDLGGRQQARPTAGQAVKFAGNEATFKVLDPKSFWQDTKFTGGYEAVDLRAAMSPDDNLTGYLYTVLDNDEPRYAELAMLTPKGDQWNTRERLDYAAWLGGQAVKEAEVVQLEKGKIPILVQFGLGTMQSAGKIWFAPRLVDRTHQYARLRERFEKAGAAWQAYQKVKDQLLTLKP